METGHILKQKYIKPCGVVGFGGERGEIFWSDAHLTMPKFLSLIIKNKILLLSVFFGLTLFLCFVISLRAQEKGTVENKDTQPKKLNLVTNLKGWKIPNFDGKELLADENIVMDDVTVNFKQYQLPRDREMEFEEYSLNSNNFLEIYKWNVVAAVVEIYSVAGGIFAYRVTNLSFIYTTAGSRSFAGLIRSCYLDNDGDGRFETRVTNCVITKVPRWAAAAGVKNNSERLKPDK